MQRETTVVQSRLDQPNSSIALMQFVLQDLKPNIEN